MTNRCIFSSMLLALCVFALSMSLGCGGGGGGTSNGIIVRITQPVHGKYMDQAQSVAITAEVVNDSSNSGVTWAIGPPSHQGVVGTLSDITAKTATYNAPGTITEETPITVTATSVKDPASAAVVGIIVEPTPVITTVSSDLLLGIVGDAYLGTINQTGGSPPFTWTVSGGVLPDGLSLSSDQNVVNPPDKPVTTNLRTIYITGKPKTSAIDTFTLQMIDATGVVTTANLSISVSPKPPKILAPTIVSGIVGKVYPPLVFTAINGVPPYTWTALSEPPPGMSFSSDGVLSGTPTTVGGYSFTIQVTDAQTPLPAINFTAVNMSVDVEDDSCNSGNESSLSSTAPYAFLLRGFDASGPVVIAGSFTTDGAGKITGGVEDINRGSGVQSGLTINPTGSSYTLVNNRGCLTLLNSAGTTTLFRFTMGTPDGSTLTSGRIIEFNDNTGTGTRASGSVRLQDPSSFSDAGFNGLYAFGFGGSNSAGGSFAMAGSANAGGGTLTSVAADIDNAGTLASALTGGTGSYNIDANGRGTASFTVGASTFNLILYMLGSTDLEFMTSDPLSASHPIGSGEAVLTNGSFSTSSLANNHLFNSTGLSSAGSDVSVGILSFDGAGKFSGTVYEDDAGTPILDPSTGNNVLLISGDYSVDPATGRTTLSGANAGDHPPVLYAVPGTGGITGFLVGTNAAASYGGLEYQVANPPLFTIDMVLGNYIFGTQPTADPLSPYLEGLMNANGNGNLVGQQDASYPGANGLYPNLNLAGNYTVQVDGSGTFGGNTASVTNGSVIFYIDESPLNVHPAVIVVAK